MNAGATSRLMLLLGLMFAVGSIHAADLCTQQGQFDQCASALDPLESCRTELSDNPGNLDARLTLCQLHLDEENLVKAHLVVSEGLSFCNRNTPTCNRLNIIASNLVERQQQANDSDPEQAVRIERAARGYCTGRLAVERAVDYCRQLLMTNPDDVEVLQSLGSKLVERGDPTGAIEVLNRGVNSGVSQSAIQDLLDRATQARDGLVRQCLDGSSLALCNDVLIAGAKDEFDIQYKRGQLMQSSMPQNAWPTLLAAQGMKPAHKELARMIVKAPTTGHGLAPARLLEAQVLAYRTLGDSAAEIASLKRLLDLVPDNTRARARLTELDPPQQDIAMEKPVQNEQPARATKPDVPLEPATIVYRNALSKDGRSH